MDNDELSSRRLEDLVLDAWKILEDGVVLLEEDDWQFVRDFLVGASKLPEIQEVWEGILKRLQEDFRKSRGKDRDSVWVKVVESVLEELKDVSKKEEIAAMQIQRCWRRHMKRPRQPLQRPRCANAHEMCLSPFNKNKEKLTFRCSARSRSSMFTRKRPARWSQLDQRLPITCTPEAPEALSVYLLSEGQEILSSGPSIETVTQFHRYCTALDTVSTAELSPSGFLAFWLNIRNLAVVVALLQLYTQPLLKLPNTLEEWTACLASTSLFVHGRLEEFWGSLVDDLVLTGYQSRRNPGKSTTNSRHGSTKPEV